MAEKKKSKLDQILNKIDSLEKGQQEIKQALENQSLRLLNQDLKFEEMDRKIDRKFDEVLTGQDKIVKELEIARNDRTIAKKNDDDQDIKLGSLEIRLKTVEEKVGVG
ncbi:hypothetical protein COT42_06395 [Candidatus Saganbacteria bacterium CG08_land_8_20_14_0_20_45_16]|uniref:Uncharacterized protein n=1 Tax=Candidatus Saganbacteria bacterium CG08_land_8_20_14_0_20_45_16 TaxID=2014293 RepID=A0A2H0XVV0_UNCSA|nr:MAG: hypothetical protein COT42_06395 [Candidatus Saganbacteria bacterium CG08_land_8_20_14_0_20_45_16]